jgi:transposase
MSKLVLGIDVGKKELSLALLKEKHLFSKKISNSESGFKAIEKFIFSHSSEKPEVYMEATGIYSTPVADYLFDHGYVVKVVNPRVIHCFAGVKKSKTKTDRSDAKLIARYGESSDDDRPYQKPPQNLRKIKALYRTYLGLKDQSTICKDHLESADEKEAIEHWESLLKSVEEHVKAIVKQIVEIIEADQKLARHFKNLQTIPGVAKITAIAAISEIQDIENFATARQLAAYFGVTPRHKESGTSVRGRPQMSKMGNSIFRKALYFSAITMMNKVESFVKFKQKQKMKGKATKQIIVAVMKKIIHAIFAIMKKDSEFNEKLLFKNT